MNDTVEGQKVYDMRRYRNMADFGIDTEEYIDNFYIRQHGLPHYQYPCVCGCRCITPEALMMHRRFFHGV